MRFRFVNFLIAGTVAAGSVSWSAAQECGLFPEGRAQAASRQRQSKSTTRWKAQFPSRDYSAHFSLARSQRGRKTLVVEVSFADRSNGIRVNAPGEFMQWARRSAGWRSRNTDSRVPMRDVETGHGDLEKIKRLSVKSPATITITGFAEGDAKLPVSSGKVTITTSQDPVGAPIFYRNVPLMLGPQGKKGRSRRYRNLRSRSSNGVTRHLQPESRVMMENLPTCANCHRSRWMERPWDRYGWTAERQGLYAIVPISKTSPSPIGMSFAGFLSGEA